MSLKRARAAEPCSVPQGADEAIGREFGHHLSALNRRFAAWVRQSINADPKANLGPGVEDYETYVSILRERYLRPGGLVLTFGSGDCGQLAHGIEVDEDLMVKAPRIVKSLSSLLVAGISCGGLHNAIYTTSGAVYTWGCNDDASLGRAGTEHEPIRVLGALETQTIIGVACGDGQTLCVSASGAVFGWGCYKDKEGKTFFNLDSSNPKVKIKRKQDVPLAISGFPAGAKVVEVACGSAHNLALCSDGVVYSWGLGESGELGRVVGEMKLPAVGDEEQQYDFPTIEKQHLAPSGMLLDAGPGVVGGAKLVAAGAYHSFVVTAGAVYSTGLNNYGQLGLGDEQNRTKLVEIVALRGMGVKAIKGGMHHSLALTSAGRVLAFGRGDSGQVGVVDLSGKGGGEAGAYIAVPVVVPLPDDALGASVSCGANHNLVLSPQGSVYSWGYGDMLALGHGQEADEAAPRKIDAKRIRGLEGYTVTQACAGGQHSALLAAKTGP